MTTEGIDMESVCRVVMYHHSCFHLGVDGWDFFDKEALDGLRLTLFPVVPLGVLENVDGDHERGIGEIFRLRLPRT